MKPRLVLALAASLCAACSAPLAQSPASDPPAVLVTQNTMALPPMPSFGAPRPLPLNRANSDMARDILDLTFRTERDQDLPVLTRFESPLTLAVIGQVTPDLTQELDRLLQRLKREAGLDIQRVGAGENPSLTIEAIRQKDLQKIVPGAGCFVLPTAISFNSFAANTRRSQFLWSRLTTREKATIFLPSDTSRQRIRNCLHEELAQSLGPINDLFRLEDSVFNDDGMHNVLTSFDMLALRAIYDPALHSGMTRPEVAAHLPEILDRLNPAGRKIPAAPLAATSLAWREAYHRSRSSQDLLMRLRAGEYAVSLAAKAGWSDTRLGLSWLSLGDALAPSSDADAEAAYANAARIFAQRPNGDMAQMRAGAALASYALIKGDYAGAAQLAERHLPAALKGEDAQLLTTLYFQKSEALNGLGQRNASVKAGLAGLAWAQYAYKTPQEIVSAATRIAEQAKRGAP
ncbi:MAG: DUF2927 domain-containing protein [Mangrovicoccus sp.]